MPAAAIFQIQLFLGYIPWLLILRTHGSRMMSMDVAHLQRAIASLHSFRFFGLVFILPGVVGPGLPPGFSTFSAYGDLATGVLAMMAVLLFDRRPLFWTFVVAFNIFGAIDILVDYCRGIQVGLPGLAGQLGAAYAIIVLYVPLLMITHLVAFYRLARPLSTAHSVAAAT